MRHFTTACFLLLALSSLVDHGTAQVEGDGQPAQVMLLGTYHFDNPGLDEHNVTVDDYFSPKRQEEIATVVQRLARFRPTKVFVEAQPEFQALLDERYEAFRSGELELESLQRGRSEIYQLGFRIAAALNHDRIYCVDAYGEWLGGEVRAAAEIEQNEVYASYEAATIELMEAMAGELLEREVYDNLAHFNRRESVLENQAFYVEASPLVTDLDAEGDDRDIGAKLLGRWYERNAKIFGRILRECTEEDERILVIFGQGHIASLHHYFSDHRGFTTVDPEPYLRVWQIPPHEPIPSSVFAKHARHFDVAADGTMQGEGADFLAGEMSASQFVILGEYHGSRRISELTRALIPSAHDAGFRTLALEVGPITAQVLTELTREPDNTVTKLAAYNARYRQGDGEEAMGPIPFFDGVEDALFLAEAARRDWALIGVDQEFIGHYPGLVDRIEASMPAAEASEAIFSTAREAISDGYEKDRLGTARFATCVDNHPAFQSMLEHATTQGDDECRAIATALSRTTAIYRANGERRYWDCNSSRVAHMKENLRSAWQRSGFDPGRDKLLLKIGGVHAARGQSGLSLYELGNTLSETAELNGSQSLHINFASRFWKTDEGVSDDIDDRYRPVLDLARPDRWTVVDLRPLHERIFYRRDYVVPEALATWCRSYDLIVIPAVDEEPRPNGS